jgi:O-antigen ligase
MPMKHIGKLSAWLDNNLIFIIATFLFVFIPLYPKLPLFDVLPGYIVRVRLEDFFVAAALVIWAIQALRKKAAFKSPLLIPIAIYLVIGLLSSISAVFITKTVPLQELHVAKMLLHWARRVEYLSLYLIFYSAIQSLKNLKILTWIYFVVVIALTIYGLGQKLYQWPVYSTMNREFAKGWRLVLTEHARVPSTFAGHYDFAAYLVAALTITGALFLWTKKILLKTISLLVFAAALTSLILTASRASFISYLVGLTAFIILLTLQKRKVLWGVKNWIALVGLSLMFMVTFGELSERFAHFFKISRIRDYIKYNLLHVQPQPEYLTLNQDLALVYTPTDAPPVPVEKKEEELPPDVYEELPTHLRPLEASEAAEASPTAVVWIIKDGKKVAVKPGKRHYSEAAFTFGLSSAIRFDALWPRAMRGFLRNPLLGSGYSTLVKVQIEEFTEAESTDNDYLRALGETGLLGFLSFYGIIALALVTAWKKRQQLARSKFIYAIAVGIAAATIGLLTNALYIDVFEASKVAFIFWALMGIFVAIVDRSSTRKNP